MSEIQYNLKTPFTYAHKGENTVAQFITIAPPSFEDMEKVTPIKQAFIAAVKSISSGEQTEQTEQASSDSDSTIEGSQVVQLMHSWDGDMVKINLYAQQLFKARALVEGETPMTIPMINKMALSDFEGLLGEYIANFIAPSLMDG